MRSIRAFIAIECPSRIREEVQKVQDGLRRALTAGDPWKITWTRPQGFHLTLKFLGEIGEDQIPRIIDAAREISETVSPFSVEIKNGGVFPGLKSPRVIWLGIESSGPDLARLQSGLEIALEPLGFLPEKRAFHPHLTLARIRSMGLRGGAFQNALEEWISGTRETSCGGFLVNELVLMRSELQTGGAVYSPISAIRLSGE